MKESYSQKHPYTAGILIALLCTFLTALGAAVPQVMGLNSDNQLIVTTVFLVFSVVIGLIIMKKSRFHLSEYGFRSSEKNTVKKVAWYLPLILIELLPIGLIGFSQGVKPMQYLYILLFVIAVGFNEEIYFRGLAFGFMKEKGNKKAVIGTSILFGVLHLANAFNGKDTLYLILQVIFAFLVGYVLVIIVNITRSLWVVIIWHAAHDYIASITNDELDRIGLIVLAIQVLILLLYGLYLWKNAMFEKTEN